VLHWHDLANMIESSVCFSDAAFLSNDFHHLLKDNQHLAKLYHGQEHLFGQFAVFMSPC